MSQIHLKVHLKTGNHFSAVQKRNVEILQNLALAINGDPTRHFPEDQMSEVPTSLSKDVWTVPASISSLTNTFKRYI